MTSSPSFLERFGLHRPELRAWALYDWANSAFILVIITAVFPIYFERVAAGELGTELATARFGLATTGALIVVALLLAQAAVAIFVSIVRLVLILVAFGCITLVGLFLWRRGDVRASRDD